MRFKILFLFLIICFSIFSYAYYSFGAGIILGIPTGINIRYNVSNANTFASTVAWNINRSSMYFSLDYHYNFFYRVKGEKRYVPFFLYTGPGFRVQSDANDFDMGVKFTGGAGFRSREIPFEFFAEVSPILDIIPATKLDLNGGIGVIFYFY